MKFKKIMLMVSVFFLIFILYSCKRTNYQVKRIYHFQDATEYDKYNVLTEKVSTESKGTIDINKFIPKDLSGFSYENYQNAASKTKITGSDKDGYICNIYYNLKEYTIKYTINGETKELPRKYRYLEKINLREVTNNYQTEFFDTISGKLVANEFLVEGDLDLIAQDGPYVAEFKKLLLKVNNQLEGLTFDDELKSPEAYFKNTKVVTKALYDKFTKAFDDFKKSLKDGKIDEKLDAFSKLANISDKIDKEVINGKKEYTDGDINLLEIKYKKLVDDLKEKINELDSKFSKAIKVFRLNDEELNKYGKDQFLLDEANYSRISTYLKNAKSDVVVKTFSKTNIIKSKENIDILEKDLLNLNEAINLYNQEGKFGKKELNTKTYKIQVYKDGVLEKEEEKTSFENNLIRLNPENVENYYVNSKSVLFGVNDGNLILKVYYEKENLLVRIDTDGGENSFYDKSYIEVKHNSKIDSDIVEKIKKVTKKDDKFGRNYRFLKYVDFYTGDEVDFTKALTKSQIIKAVYEKDAIAPFNYEIEYYVDRVDSKTLDPEYSNNPQKTVSSVNEVNVGDLVAFSPNDMPAEYRNGFEIDMDKSVLSYGKIGLGDKLKVYLKRKILRVDLDTTYKDKKAVIEDERIINNKLSIKYGTIFNIYPEKAMIELGGNKVAIFDKLVDAETNMEYELGKKVDKNLNLKVVYKEIDKSNLTKINFTKGYIGKKIVNDKEVEEVLYIEKNTKIKDPAFFETTTSDSVASLDIENNVGFIKDKSDIFKTINKDTIFTKQEYTLEFIYRMNIEKMEALKKELFKEQKYLKAKDKEFEIKGKVTAIFEDGKQFFIETENGMVFARVSGALSQSQIDNLKVNNEISISGKLNQNFSDIYSSKIDYKVGRFTDYILSIDNTTRIKLLNLGANNDPKIEELGDSLKDAKSLTRANVGELTILDTMGKVATNVPGYDDGVVIPKYYTYKVVDKYSNVSYLYMDENNPNVKYFLDLNKGDIINIKGAYLINARVKRKGIPAFNDGATKSFLGIFVTDFNTQVEYITQADKRINVNLNVSFEKYENWTSFENRSKKYELYKNTNLETIIKDYFEYNIFNGYKVKDVKINNTLIEKDKYYETKLNDNDNIEIIMEKEVQYINFYYGTYLPKELIPNLKLIGHKGGMEYETYPVDYDEGFYRFVLAYDKKDLYTELTIKYTDTVYKKIILNLANKNPNDVRSYAAMETCKYSLIHGNNSSFGNLDLHSISYEWGDILPEEILNNNKGLFIHPFSLDGPSGAYAEEYADRSLYSAILMENTNIATPDGEKNINKDHNMLSNYTQYDGNRFYQFDGSLSEGDINSSKKFNIRAFIKMYLKDTDENGIDYATNKIVRYYFHKSSFSKYARFNKFGLGYLFADLTPFVNGKLLANKSLASDLSAKEQNDAELAKSDDRIIQSLPEFLEYLRKNNVKSYDNIFKNLREYDRLEFNIIENNDITFKNNKKTIDLSKKIYDEITPEELGINNPTGKKLLFVDLDTMEIVDFNYRYDNKKVRRYGILTYEEKDIEISVLENSKNINKTKLIESYFGKYGKESLGSVNGVIKTHKFKMPYNKDFPQLFKYFKHSDGLLDELDYDYSFKISIADESLSYVYFATSKKIIPIKNGYKKFVLALKNNDNQEFKDEVVNYVLKVVDKQNQTKIYPLSGMLYDNVGYFEMDYTNPKDYKEINVYKNSSLNNKINSNKITIDDKPFSIKLIDRDSGGKVVRFKNISDNADSLFNYKKITINPINLTWDNNLGISKVEYLYSYNYLDTKIKLRKEMFNRFYKPGYEMIYTYVINGVEKPFDIDDAILENGTDIVVNIYYKLKYKPGEYYKLLLNFGKGDSYSKQDFGYIEALKNRLYYGKELYVKKGASLSFLKNVLINSDWLNYKTFTNWKISGGAILQDGDTFDGSKDIELIAQYTDSALTNIIKREYYIENVSNGAYEQLRREQFILNKTEDSYKVDKTKLDIPNGYEIDYDKSTLELKNINALAAHKRVLKIYYKAKRYDVSINLNGGSITQDGENYLLGQGFLKQGSTYKKQVAHGVDIHKIIYEFITKYTPKKDDKSNLGFSINDEALIKYNILKPGENIVDKDIMISFKY